MILNSLIPIMGDMKERHRYCIIQLVICLKTACRQSKFYLAHSLVIFHLSDRYWMLNSPIKIIGNLLVKTIERHIHAVNEKHNRIWNIKLIGDSGKKTNAEVTKMYTKGFRKPSKNFIYEVSEDTRIYLSGQIWDFNRNICTYVN